MTFRQYSDDLISKCAQKNSCTLKDAALCYPDHIVRKLHGEECLTAAKNNFILPMKVLDSLTTLQRYRIFHDLPDYLSLWVRKSGRPYINPEARKESRQKFFDFRRANFQK